MGQERLADLIIVDTSALMAILLGEPEGKRFFEVLVTSGPTLLGAPTLLEFMMVAHRDRIADPTGRIAELLSRLSLEVIAWETHHVQLALDAFLRFGEGRHPAKLNFGDCMSYALAKSLDAPLLYKGEDFALTDVRSAVAR